MAWWYFHFNLRSVNRAYLCWDFNVGARDELGTVQYRVTEIEALFTVI
jgi:hypothetical protein